MRRPEPGTERVKLIENPCSFALDEEHQLVDCTPFVGREGVVIEIDDIGYDAERPTGYEPIYCLVDFGDQKIWIPEALYMGDKDGKEVWSKHLKYLPSFGRIFKVRFVHDVDRFPHFVVPKDATGVLVQLTDKQAAVKLDKPLKGCEEWDHHIYWADPFAAPHMQQDIEII